MPGASRRVLIAGAGIAGLSLALALRQGLGAAFEVVVCDPVLAAPPRPDHRAWAVAAGGCNLLRALDLWPALEAGAQPITAMDITDSRTGDAIRPVFLTFDGPPAPGEPFAHMLESAALTPALIEACRAAGVTLLAQRIDRATPAGASATALLTDGTEIQAALIVAADGARSRLRAAAGIGWVGRAYGQSGLVATIGHERPHGGRAIEHFLPAGPFAMLPLRPGGSLGHRSSIVWTERSEDAQALLSLDADDLREEIARRFGHERGEIALESPVLAAPLAVGLARALRGPRLALLGDAAHLIHPIAGQGLNLGLKDVAALAEAIADAARLGLDVGSDEVLARYERARRFDNAAMAGVTDTLNRLFSNDSGPLRLARDLGLGLVDRLPRLKRRFIGEAAGDGAGLAGETPRLLRGEPV